MGKELSEMALEELWDLFPIFLVQHDARWYEYYKEIESTITDLLASYPVKRISHRLHLGYKNCISLCN